MTCYARRLATVVALVLLLVTALEAAEKTNSAANALSPQAEAMTIWQARRIVVAGNSVLSFQEDAVDRSSFRFTPDGFEFDATGPKHRTLHFSVDLKKLEAVSIKCHNSPLNKNRWCTLTDEAGKNLRKTGSGVEWYAYYRLWMDHGVMWRCSAECAVAAKSFAVALNSLRTFANDTEFPLRTSTKQAAAWRALPAKPPVPDEVRAQRLLAEDAIKQRNLGEALNRYDTGIQMYPTWPQGRFNAALIAAELGYFAEAAEHMQAYLELVPDAPDAQSARDQLVAWQYRVKHPVQARP